MREKSTETLDKDELYKNVTSANTLLLLRGLASERIPQPRGGAAGSRDASTFGEVRLGGVGSIGAVNPRVEGHNSKPGARLSDGRDQRIGSAIVDRAAAPHRETRRFIANKTVGVAVRSYTELPDVISALIRNAPREALPAGGRHGSVQVLAGAVPLRGIHHVEAFVLPLLPPMKLDGLLVLGHVDCHAAVLGDLLPGAVGAVRIGADTEEAFMLSP